ncbi:MAG: porin family protein [Bacteroidota bacterium]
MKKTLFTVFSLFAFAVAANAQISGGVKAGVNFANQDYEASGFSVSPDGRTAFHAGAFFTIMFADQLGLQPEILYSGQGSTFESVSPGFDDIEQNFNYLNIPVLLRYQVIDILSLHTGPQLGFLLNAEIDDEDVKDSLKGSDLSLAFGGQVDLPMGFIGGLRYSLGLSDINDLDGDGTEIKNNNFQIYVGFKLFGE